METAQHSEDLFGSQDDTSLREAQSAVEAAQQNSSKNTDENEQNANDTEKEARNTTENETPDLVFSSDVDFGEHSEKQSALSSVEDHPENLEEQTSAAELEGNEEEEPTTELAEQSEAAAPRNIKESPEERLAQFPFARVKQIMKLDPDVGIVSAEAIFVVTKAAELFLQTLAKDASSHTLTSKKKTMAARDVELAIDSVDALMFLEGMMNVK
uniref:Transcription factor CBF/NF-Y/archaeal histone domain-containing protein n=1 Tax=Anopheles atroparvus TaxID=41427 RepID=A0AAG5DGY2_ANOAO